MRGWDERASGLKVPVTKSEGSKQTGLAGGGRKAAGSGPGNGVPHALRTAVGVWLRKR